MSDLDKYGSPRIKNIKEYFYLKIALICIRAIATLRACRPIPEPQVRELCYKARELLIEEGNVVGVDAPVTVSI